MTSLDAAAEGTQADASFLNLFVPGNKPQLWCGLMFDLEDVLHAVYNCGH